MTKIPAKKNKARVGLSGGHIFPWLIFI